MSFQVMNFNHGRLRWNDGLNISWTREALHLALKFLASASCQLSLHRQARQRIPSCRRRPRLWKIGWSFFTRLVWHGGLTISEGICGLDFRHTFLPVYCVCGWIMLKWIATLKESIKYFNHLQSLFLPVAAMLETILKDFTILVNKKQQKSTNIFVGMHISRQIMANITFRTFLYVFLGGAGGKVPNSDFSCTSIHEAGVWIRMGNAPNITAAQQKVAEVRWSYKVLPTEVIVYSSLLYQFWEVQRFEFQISWVLKGDVYTMFIPCLYHVYTMFISCSYHVYTMFIPCSYHVYTMFISCSYHVYTMFIPCSYHVHTMFIPCLYHVYTMFIPCLYHVHTMFIPCLYHVCTMFIPCL